MKYIVIIMILGGSIWQAIMLTKQYENRYQVMLLWKEAITMIKSQIEYCMLPLPDIFCEIGNYIKEPVGSFFLEIALEMGKGEKEKFEIIWKRKLKEFVNDHKFFKQEEDVFLQFGLLLGKREKECETAGIELYDKRMDGAIVDMEKNLPQKKKVTRTVVISIGLFLTIIII